MSLVQVIPLGGCGEIGKNCTAVVQGEDVILVDCGLSFPHEEQYGVDIVIPDFTWIVENKDRIRGLFLTHAHEDHIGAVSYLLKEVDIPIFASAFTEAMLKMKVFEKDRNLEPRIVRMAPGDKVKVGSITVEPVQVTHSIPETFALAVGTEHGILLFTADFKFDFSPVDGRTSDIRRLAELGEEGVLLLLSDSTNIDRKGWGPSESIVGDGLKDIFLEAPGRVMLTTFSSNIHRMQQAFDAAHATGRKVAIAGRRMDATVNMCQSLNYLKVPKGTYQRLEDVSKIPANELVILVTGSQGEPSAALSQMSRKEYSRLKIVPGDTILYSARPIPGNEGSIYRTVNKLVQLGARVVLEHDRPIHASGHGHQEELKMMVNLTKPFYVAPVHGEPRHQVLFEEMLTGMGHPKHRIFKLGNGDSLYIDDNKAWIGEGVQAGEVLLDQAAGVQVTEDVLSDRFHMAHNGVVVVTVTVDKQAKCFVGKPLLTAAGFCGTDEDVDEVTRHVVDQISHMKPDEIINRPVLEDQLVEPVRRSMGRMFRQKPVVIPVILGLD